MKPVSETAARAIDQIAAIGGLVRTREALELGIQSRVLKQLVLQKKLEQISRGVYRIPGKRPISNPDLFTVAARIPSGVICLLSALSFHDITTQIPNKVFIALERRAETPRLDYPPISVHRFSGKAFTEGVEVHMVDGIGVKVYSMEKTLADCFKFRNKIGMDVAIEALKFYRSRKKIKMNDVYHYAKICRVQNIMRPYLEVVV
jgi:predicted transcriptional regulator of viral defense system